MCSSIRWAFNVGNWTPTESEWLYAARCIQQEEKDRIGRKGFAKAAKDSMAGRLMMRKVITDCLKMPWGDIQLDRTEEGKPCLSHAASVAQDVLPEFTFNISHDGDYVVLVAEEKGSCGIDVLTVQRPGKRSIPDYFKLMERRCSANEWSIIYGAGDEWDQLEMFYRVWCLKESYVKAVGSTYGKTAHRLECHLKTLTLTKDSIVTDTQMNLDNEPLLSWCFEETKLDGNHYVAVARHYETNKAEVAPSFKMLTFPDLISSAIPMLPEDVDYWSNFASKPEKANRKQRQRNSEDIDDGDTDEDVPVTVEYQDTDDEEMDEPEAAGDNGACTLL